jgi:hypothetical protein
MELSELKTALYKSNFTSEEYNELINTIQQIKIMNTHSKIAKDLGTYRVPFSMLELR